MLALRLRHTLSPLTESPRATHLLGTGTRVLPLPVPHSSEGAVQLRKVSCPHLGRREVWCHHQTTFREGPEGTRYVHRFPKGSFFFQNARLGCEGGSGKGLCGGETWSCGPAAHDAMPAGPAISAQVGIRGHWSGERLGLMGTWAHIKNLSFAS